MPKDLSQATLDLANITTVDGLRNVVRGTSATVGGAPPDATSLLCAGKAYGIESFD